MTERESESAPPALVSRGWRRLFLVEVPLTLATCVYWLFFAEQFVETMFGAGAASPAALALVAQMTGVVLSLVVWFYGRWLSSGRVEVRAFRYLQEGFAAGDVVLIALAIDALRRGVGEPAAWAAQAAMAGSWLAIRVVFLVAVRPRVPAPVPSMELSAAP